MKLLSIFVALVIGLSVVSPVFAASDNKNLNLFEQFMLYIVDKYGDIRGATGIQGLPGLNGLDGQKGDTGPIGPIGMQGEIGPIGVTGEMGPIGATGETGLRGEKGLMGDMGGTGSTGIQGPVGATGLQGPTGKNGMTGAGNIAFVTYSNGHTYVLRTDRKIVGLGGINQWIYYGEFADVPIDTSNILQWNLYNFLDIDGNVWTLQNNTWTNGGYPPIISPTPIPTPTPVVLNFGSGISGESSVITIPSGYKSMTFHVSNSGGLPGWAALVSFNQGSTFYEEQRFPCSGTTCTEFTLPILSDTYKFSPGSGSTWSVTATLNSESGAQVSVLGQNVSYPFTSNSFTTTGFQSLSLSIGSGNNPQHLTGVSVQKNELGVYVEKGRLSCDGGASCEVKSFTVDGGTYRVVVEGSGTGSVFGAILRP